ncbi:MAG TPA: ABC transporter permease, partial [Polyangiaceae bacterium]|nr:ABC transporter permease [Polyangiaceae bacterium]
MTEKHGAPIGEPGPDEPLAPSVPKCGVVGVPQPWSVGDSIGHGWMSLRKNAAPLFVSYLFYLVLSVSLGAGVGLGARAALAARAPLNAVVGWGVGAFVLGSLVLGALVGGGLLHAWITAARGDRVVLGQALFRVRGAFRLAIAYVLLFLVALIPAFGIPFWGYSLAPHFIVDQDMGVREAMRASWQATRGYKGTLWLFGLCLLPVQILGLTFGGIGLCATTPIAGIALSYAYVRVTGRTDLPPYTPEFAARSMRVLLRTTLAVFAAGFATCVFLVHALPPVRGSAWTPVDAAVRVATILLGIASTIVLLAALLPWLLDRLERAKFALFVGARHVRSQKSGFLTVISVLSICGVAISSCALSSVISVMGGFSNDLKHKILGNNAHIVIDTVSQQPWADYGPVLDQVRAVPGVVAATPVVSGEVMMSSPSNLAGVIVRGVDPLTIGDVIDLKNNIEVGKFHYLEDPELLRHLPPEEVIG